MQRKTWAALVLALAVGAFISAGEAAPKGPKRTPPGWSKGEKKGWKGGDKPPGLQKQSGSEEPTVKGLAEKVQDLVNDTEKLVGGGEGKGRGRKK